MIDKGSPGGAQHLGKFIQNHESCILLLIHIMKDHMFLHSMIFLAFIGRKL